MTVAPRSLCWLRELPGVRDYMPKTDSIAESCSRSRALKRVLKTAPRKVGQRKWCPPIEVRGDLGFCTANTREALLDVVLC